jgi:hypothetical protein
MKIVAQQSSRLEKGMSHKACAWIACGFSGEIVTPSDVPEEFHPLAKAGVLRRSLGTFHGDTKRKFAVAEHLLLKHARNG